MRLPHSETLAGLAACVLTTLIYVFHACSSLAQGNRYFTPLRRGRRNSERCLKDQDRGIFLVNYNCYVPLFTPNFVEHRCQGDMERKIRSPVIRCCRFALVADAGKEELLLLLLMLVLLIMVVSLSLRRTSGYVLTASQLSISCSDSLAETGEAREVKHVRFSRSAR